MGFFGGDSTSVSTTQVFTTDKRQVADNGAIGISSDTSTISFNDASTIKAAADLVARVDASATDRLNTITELAADTLKGALAAANANSTMFDRLSSSVADAYQTAAAQTSKNEQRPLLYLVAAVVGIAAIWRYKKG